MKLVENYLAEVATHLSADNKDDIIVELRSDIEERLEDSAEQKGRDYNEQDAVEVLKALGHPVLVATRFNKQQHLIGPSLFPAYKHALKLTVLAVLLIQVVLTISTYMLAGQTNVSEFGLMFSLLESAIYVAFSVTVIFAVLEYSGDKLNWYHNWDPSGYKSVSKITASRQDAITNVITDTVVFIWWNNWFGREHQMPFGPGDFPVMVTGVYDAVYWPVNVLLLLSLALYGWQLFNCQWNRLNIQIAIGVDVAFIAVLLYMLNAGSLFALKEANAELEVILGKVNFSASLVLVVIAGVIAYDLYGHIKNWRKL